MSEVEAEKGYGKWRACVLYMPSKPHRWVEYTADSLGELLRRVEGCTGAWRIVIYRCGW